VWSPGVSPISRRSSSRVIFCPTSLSSQARPPFQAA
jgi:hypothetical protein